MQDHRCTIGRILKGGRALQPLPHLPASDRVYPSKEAVAVRTGQKPIIANEGFSKSKVHYVWKAETTP